MITGPPFIDRLYEELPAYVMEFSLKEIDPMSPWSYCTVREFRTCLRSWNQIVPGNPVLWKDVEVISPFIAAQTDVADELRRLRFIIQSGKKISRHLAITVQPKLPSATIDSESSPPPFNLLTLPAFDIIRQEGNFGSRSP
jgi:hypothetical protein